MASTDIPSLGPQCLSCKRRRVRCDSTTPSCGRCERDNIPCPGYRKELKWTPPFVAQKRKTKANPSRTRQFDTDPSLSLLAFPESLEEYEFRLLYDSSQYYNTYILPDTVPAHLPFKRDDHIAHHWNAAPRVLRNLLIVLVKSAQNRNSTSEPSSELYHYRARALEDLKYSLADAVADPYGIALSGIMVLMGIDLLDPRLGGWSWLYHFCAAKRLIQLRGGFGACFFGLPHSQGLLLKYSVVDVFSMTTCNTSEISQESAMAQMTYIPITLLREQSLVETHLCPQPLLQAIIRTNLLRVQSQKSWSKFAGKGLSFGDIMSDVLEFDVWRWSEKVSFYGLARPHKPSESPVKAAIETWNALALAYQRATQLYLLVSIRAPTTLEDSAHLLVLNKCLSLQIDLLFDIASADPNGPIQTQCWKFASWPIIVSVIVGVCWCCRSIEDMEQELRRVETVAEALGSSALTRASCFVRSVANRRAARLEAAWSWNDVFPSRCAFVAC